MTVVEIAKLAEWLEMHDHTAEEVIECIRYIAGKEANKKEELTAKPTKQNG